MTPSATTQCKACGAPFTQSRRGRPRLYCYACGRLHSQAQGEAGDDLDPREYGPAEPQHGMSPQQAEQYRHRRLVELVQEGVPAYAVAERLGMTPNAVSKAASRLGLRCASSLLPFGAPAP